MRTKRTQRLLSIAAATTVVAVGWMLASQERRDRVVSALRGWRGAGEPASASVVSVVDADDPAVAEDRLSVASDPATPEVEQAATRTTLWTPTDGAPPELAGMLNGMVSDPMRVRVERDALATLEVGSAVSIELPGGGRYVARVDRLIAHEDGDRSWSGHLDGFGDRYPVVYTQGDAMAFGTIATPDGLFALEATDADGVIYRDQRDALHASPDDCQVFHD